MKNGRSKLIIALVCVTLLTGILPVGAYAAEDSASRLNSKFRVGAYYYEEHDGKIEDIIQFDKVDYVMYSFITTYMDGNLRPLKYPDRLKEMVTKAHEKGVKAFVSIGGTDAAYDLDAAASTPDTRTRFINSIIGLVDDYNLDGVDIDWEVPFAGDGVKNCETLMVALGQKLKAKGIYFTAAVPGVYQATQGTADTNAFTDACIASFDWLHIMTYSLKEENSPKWFTNVSLQYWNKVRKVSKDKLVVGLPFYALPSYRNYNEIVAENPENAFVDSIPAGANGEVSNYNGLNMIKEKTKMALADGGGVFSWTTNWDTSDEYSLTTAAYNTIQTAEAVGVTTYLNIPAIIFKNHEIIYDANIGFPYIDQNGRTMVPFRKTAETAGMTVTFDTANNMAIASMSGKTIKIPIGQQYILVNDTITPIDTMAVTYNNRTYIPMRALFEGMGYKISSWQQDTNTAYITQ